MSVVDHASAVAAPSASRAPARLRILETADRLFYSEGIRSVGVDRLIAESGVTKATFYKHFGSKDNLITEYLEGRHLRVRELVAATAAGVAARDVVRTLVGGIADNLGQPGFRGSAFLVAAGEFADRDHPVRTIVAAHRDWCAVAITRLLEEAGVDAPAQAAAEILLATDGAMTGGYAGDPEVAIAALTRSVERILGPV